MPPGTPADPLSDALDIPMTKMDPTGIKLLALDADGVLTDGGVYVFEDGRQFRRFDIKDGLGLKRVMEAGIHVAIISGSAVQAVAQRAQQLGIKEIHLGVEDKLAKLQTICHRYDVCMTEVAYMGDDLTDIEVLNAVGFSCAPADAARQVQQVSKYVTNAKGGHSAVRELCDKLLFVRLEALI